MSPNQNRSKAILKSEPYYTNEDVAILHNIVSHAEELLSVLPERERIPTNALFHAYYAILPKIGLDANHDNRYARVLFKIGGRRGEGTLYEKFENVLSQMGIDIQFDYIDENEANRSRSPVGDSSTLLSETNAHATAGDSLARLRRNSETAAWPMGFGRTEQTQPRARSSSPHSTLQTPARQSQIHYAALPVRQMQNGRGQHRSSEQRSKEIESWMSSRQHGAENHNNNHRPREFDYLNPAPPHEVEYVDEAAQTGMDSYAVEVDADQRYRQSILDQPLYYEKESSELDDWTGETDEFNIQRVRSRHDKALLRRLFSKWHQQALRQQHHFAQLSQEAEHKDRIMLLRPAFDTWRSRVLQIQQEREDERIQIEQEEMAVHAKEIYLLHKYFTRWVSVCREEQKRVEAARQRILTLRFFNIWRDYTAEMQLKVRSLLQRKFLQKWRAKRAHNADKERQSVITYERNLVKRFFWEWFWKFCESRAPNFWQENSKRRRLETWRFHNDVLELSITIGQQSHDLRTHVGFIRAWKEKSRVYRELEITAKEQYERKLREQTLALWKHQHHLVAVKKEADRKIGNILVKSLLSKWRLHTKQEQEATKLNDRQILKGALLNWRYQAKAKQLERYHKRHAFQAWRLAVQVKKANRIFREKLLRKFMPRLVKTTQQAVVTIKLLTMQAEDVHDRYLARSVLHKWRERLHAVNALPQRALNMRPAPIIKDCLEKWVAAKRKTDQIENWAADAEFYRIGKKTFSKWREATEASKKGKIKVAYAQARRQNKLNLAKLMLDKWRAKADADKEINAVAADVLENKSMAIASNALVIWRGKSQDLAELNGFANLSRQRKVFSQWKVRLAQADRHMAAAEESDTIRLRARCLKKWAREALQMRAREHLASELRDKRAKRSLRLAFNYWRQTLQIRQNAGLLFDPHVPASPRPAASVRPPKLNRQVETLINFDESILMSPVKPHIKDMSPMKATPLPAYLNTPSRRSTLARSMVEMAAVSTTPAGTPFVPAPFGRSVGGTTPFERQLRGGSGNPLSAYTRRTAARPLSKLRAFDDLVEEAPRDHEDEI